MRVFAISDLHVDYMENALWVQSLSKVDYIEDVLILAGDISDTVARFAECVQALASKFKHVFFVPGNHDIWINKSEPKCSIEKFHHVIDVARENGAITQMAKVGEYTFIPLYSWYDFSFGEPSDYLKAAWMDFKRCRWPEHMAHPRDVHDYFVGLNTFPKTPIDGNIISFSHFLPRLDLMPSFLPEKPRALFPVLGSAALDQWVRKSGAKIHIYGHSHLNRDVTLDGVRYVNNAWGYPGEERIARKELVCIASD